MKKNRTAEINSYPLAKDMAVTFSFVSESIHNHSITNALVSVYEESQYKTPLTENVPGAAIVAARGTTKSLLFSCAQTGFTKNVLW